ncbi:hypothetical protein L3049_17495 [Labilibaculum sp. DW002]|uniref:Uncharacterized protein n=1 Tax=Paralabilibaculum antarcticum TaxID=2912572 RepID=A0ABT5VZ12_9BACT|nr:hypothetical protein [Labilibaculum sp. DW002]MDE5419788.1 hypothetical protein [Labilibaculum sp. DW002]
MKKQLFVIAAMLILAFSACSKDSEEVKSEQDLYTVNFKSSFTSSFKSADLSADLPTFLDYVLFNAEGKYVKELKFLASEQVVDELSAGDYILKILGNSSSYSWETNDYIWGDQYLNSFYFSDHEPSKSVFGGTLNFTVNENATFDLTLNRLTSQVQVYIKDLPSNAGKIEMTLYDASYGLYLENYTPSSPSDSRVVSTDWTETSDEVKYHLHFSMFDTEAEFTHEGLIKVFDKSGQLISSKEVHDIKTTRNKITYIEGNIMPADPGTNTGFTITYNSNWGETINVQFE